MEPVALEQITSCGCAGRGFYLEAVVAEDLVAHSDCSRIIGKQKGRKRLHISNLDVSRHSETLTGLFLEPVELAGGNVARSRRVSQISVISVLQG